jgi:hypothetical protein
MQISFVLKFFLFFIFIVYVFISPLLTSSVLLPSLILPFLFLILLDERLIFFVFGIVLLHFMTELVYFETYGLKTASLFLFCFMSSIVISQLKSFHFFLLWQKFVTLMIVPILFENGLQFLLQKSQFHFFELMLYIVSTILVFPLLYLIFSTLRKNLVLDVH